MSDAVAFYRDRLGFSVPHQEEAFAIVMRDNVEIHLWSASDERWKARSSTTTTPVVSGAESFIAGTASCRIEVKGIDALFAEYRGKGTLYNPTTAIELTPWGTREFPALDLDRNLLTFYESV